MAKIIKVGSNNPTFTSKSANPAKPSREVTNPFKYVNFEGNTLPYADVFEGFQPKSASKLRMIASSVTGSMNKMRSSIAEPIINFVNRVRGGLTNAWTYAKNTNISDVPGIKEFNELMNTPININLPSMKGLSEFGKGISENASALGRNISSKMEFLNRDVLDIGRDMSAQWNSLISSISFHGKAKYATMSVAELEIALKDALANGGV